MTLYLISIVNRWLRLRGARNVARSRAFRDPSLLLPIVLSRFRRLQSQRAIPYEIISPSFTSFMSQCCCQCSAELTFPEIQFYHCSSPATAEISV